jgi:arsenite methyltransferase
VDRPWTDNVRREQSARRRKAPDVLSLEDIISERFDFESPELVAAFDDLPLWSAPFGLLLLDTVRMRPSLRALDIGSGSGFPLLELAQRLGPESQVVGLDPWRSAAQRARLKARFYRVANVELVEGVAEQMPFPDAHFDLVVSNNGLNNVEDPDRSLAECARVSAPGAQLVFTANLPETMQAFYDVFSEMLRATGHADRVMALGAHIAAKRPTRAVWEARVRKAGLTLDRVLESRFLWRFASGRALLRHGFIRLGFLDGWKAVLAPDDVLPVFRELERRLDGLAQVKGEIALGIPYACYDCRR